MLQWLGHTLRGSRQLRALNVGRFCSVTRFKCWSVLFYTLRNKGCKKVFTVMPHKNNLQCLVCICDMPLMYHFAKPALLNCYQPYMWHLRHQNVDLEEDQKLWGCQASTCLSRDLIIISSLMHWTVTGQDLHVDLQYFDTFKVCCLLCTFFTWSMGRKK